jgi:hypothetical protein
MQRELKYAACAFVNQTAWWWYVHAVAHLLQLCWMQCGICGELVEYGGSNSLITLFSDAVMFTPADSKALTV